VRVGGVVAFTSVNSERQSALRMATSVEQIHVRQDDIYSPAELRLLYQLFEEAQRSRIAHGERLRAIFQGRSSSVSEGATEDADALVKAVSRGETVGAPRTLEHAYARAVRGETEAAAALGEAVENHPVWPWLSSVKGIGVLLAARLLSRLDITRAKTPSSFWAYCGLGTIPGVAYRCTKCGFEVAYPLGYHTQESHTVRSGSLCAGELRRVDDAANPTRVAPRRSLLGGRAGYDAEARKSCYLIGVSMLRCRSDYRSFYDEERGRLATFRPGWASKRCHLSALRRVEKAFLRDLWIAWRKASGLPVVAPYFPRID
jgi:transposase IS116/IS110/IS902 family protein